MTHVWGCTDTLQPGLRAELTPLPQGGPWVSQEHLSKSPWEGILVSTIPKFGVLLEYLV